MFLHIRATKTIQFLQQALSIPLPIIPGSPLCPVMAVINHLRLNSVGPSDSLFSVRSPYAKSTQPITYYYFSKFLAKAVTALGLDMLILHIVFTMAALHFPSHVNVPADLIKLQGDWSSDVH